MASELMRAVCDCDDADAREMAQTGRSEMAAVKLRKEAVEADESHNYNLPDESQSTVGCETVDLTKERPERVAKKKLSQKIS